MRAHPHKFGLLGSHINSDLLSSPANDLFATSVHQGSHPNSPAQRPENSGSDTTRVRTKLDKTQHNRVIILQLATKKITRPDALRNAVRLGVGETHKEANKFFMTTCHDFRLLCLLSLRSRSKTSDLRASETRYRPPTPWAIRNTRRLRTTVVRCADRRSCPQALEAP